MGILFDTKYGDVYKYKHTTNGKNVTFVGWENPRTFDAVHVFYMTPLKVQCRYMISINSLFGQ